MGDTAQPPRNVSQGNYALVTHSVLTALALIVVTFRCAARLITKGFLLDDYFMVVAMSLAVANLVFTIVGVHYGLGRHVVYLEYANVVRVVRGLVVGEFLLLVSLCFVKVSVLLFMLGFGGVKKWLRWTLFANVAVICASTLAFVVTLFTQCRPVQANWDATVPGAHCIPIQAFMNSTYVLTAFTIVTDFICALLPIPIILKLKLDQKTKMSIMAIILLGLFAAACSIVRIVLVKDLRHSREDPTWQLVPLGVWTVIELHVAIIVASVPPCRALVLRLMSRVRGQPYATTQYTHDNTMATNRIRKSVGYMVKHGAVGVDGKNVSQESWLRMDRLEHDAGSNDGSQDSRLPPTVPPAAAA